MNEHLRRELEGILKLRRRDLADNGEDIATLTRSLELARARETQLLATLRDLEAALEALDAPVASPADGDR